MGVAAYDAKGSMEVEVRVNGAIELPKTAGDAVVAGAPVIANASRVIDAVGAVTIGYAVAGAVAGTNTVACGSYRRSLNGR